MIKYPNEIRKKQNRICNYGNRGMTLEHELNDTNNYYLEKDIAIIYKKPTPIGVVKQVNEKIVDAYFKTPSTTDYNGLYKGKYIDFEAKETTSKTSFPLGNIHRHQIEHIRRIINHGGISFLIIRFTSLNLTYLLFGIHFIKYISESKRKSIPLEYFKNNAYLIKDGLAPRVNYLEIIDKYGGIYEKTENSKR